MIDPTAESQSLQDLLLTMPQEHSSRSLLEMAVRRIAAREHVAQHYRAELAQDARVAALMAGG